MDSQINSRAIIEGFRYGFMNHKAICEEVLSQLDEAGLHFRQVPIQTPLLC